MIASVARESGNPLRPKKRLISASIACGVAVAIVLAIYWAGHTVIRSSLSNHARAIAETWYRAALHSARGDLDQLIRNMADQYEREALRSAGIDAVVALGVGTGVETLIESPNAGADSLLNAIGASGGADLFSLRAGSFPVGELGWLMPRSFRSWVLLPSVPSSNAQLALSIEQSAAAQHLTYSFVRQVGYTLGTGIIAFFAFMAGYSYRAKGLMKDQEELRRVALHDSLTGLPNRKQFDTRLAEAIKVVSKGRGRAAIMLLDLDGFKAVNDTLGHQTGDELLKATAQRLSGALRKGDLLARLSGDEFAIIVPQFSEVSRLTAIAERIQVLMSQSFEIGGQRIMVGCSIGIAVAPENGNTAEALFRNADFALYRAKEAGKRTWRFFDPNMAEELHRRLSIEDSLRISLDRDMFTIVYQPQIDLATGRTAGYEALLRWQLPGDRLATTASFLRIAEETGLIIPIGETVIRQAIQDCAHFPEHARIAINLSPAQLKHDDIAGFFATVCNENGVDPRRLDIEVGEAVLGRDEATVFANLTRIRELGVSIVLDDFRPSSFGLLTRVPFDKLKLSGKFLAGIDEDAKARAIVAAICNLGRSLEMEVSAQGVETAELAESLPLLGCTRAQGNYFGKPRPIAQFTTGQAADDAGCATEQLERVESLEPDLLLLPDFAEESGRLARVA